MFIDDVLVVSTSVRLDHHLCIQDLVSIDNIITTCTQKCTAEATQRYCTPQVILCMSSNKSEIGNNLHLKKGSFLISKYIDEIKAWNLEMKNNISYPYGTITIFVDNEIYITIWKDMVVLISTTSIILYFNY